MNYYSSGVSWRFPMAFQAFLALLMSLMLFFMPECKNPVTKNSSSGYQILKLTIAPRYLLKHEREAEAATILRLLRKKGTEQWVVASDVAEIKEAIALELHTKGWRDLLKDDHVRSRRRVGLACLIQSMQAFSGSTPINYYTTVM